MRQFLKSIFTFIIATLAVACQNEPPHEPIEPKPFAFENKHIKHTELSLNISPEDKELEYVVLFAEKRHFIVRGIDTREELIADDLAMLRDYANHYGITIREFLEGMKWIVKGDKTGYMVTNLYPDTDDESYEATTEVYYEVITTTAPELQDIEFNIEAAINGNSVAVTMTPNNYDGLYYSYIVPDTDSYYLPEGAEFNADYLAHYRNMTLDTFNELINNQGIPAEQFCHSGATTRNERLNPTSGYMVLCFAVSDDQTPILCSEPSVAYFTTNESNKSDLTIKIEVTDITQYNAICNSLE